MTNGHLITQFDFFILDFIRENLRCDFLDYLMQFLSYIGEAGAVWFAIAFVMLFFKKTRVCAVVMILSMGVCLILGEFVLKNLVCRVRPCHINLSVEMLVKKPRSYSFPSGHTSSSFAAATAIFIYNKKFGVAALLLAALIAFSRLYNYVHYPTDVLAGMLFGVASTILIYHLIRKYNYDKRIENFKLRRCK